MSSLVKNFNEIDKSVRYIWNTKVFVEVQKYPELTESQQIRLYIFIRKAFEKKVENTYFLTNPAVEMSDIIEDNPNLSTGDCSKIFIDLWIREFNKAHSDMYSYLKKLKVSDSTRSNKNTVLETILSVETNVFPFVIKSRYFQNDLYGASPPITIKELLPYVKKTLNSVNVSMSKKEFENPLQTLNINHILRSNFLPDLKFNKQPENDTVVKIINFIFDMSNIWDWAHTLLYNDKFNFLKIIEIIRITINKHIDKNGVQKRTGYTENDKFLNSMFLDLINELKSREVEWNKEKQVVVNKSPKVKNNRSRGV